MGSGGTIMKSPTTTVDGTISQTTIGRMVRPNAADGNHNIGFWYWAKRLGGYSLVRLPRVAADAGARVVIPLILEESNGLFRYGPMRWRARIRFNGTLLEPADLTPDCEWVGEDCVLEIEGLATSPTGVLYDLVFTAKLGNDVNTPLIIEEFEWLSDDDNAIEVKRKHGEFTLLGICREGDQARLVFSTGLVARVSVMPNPAREYVTFEFVAGERGNVTIDIVDGLGAQVANVVNQAVEGDRMYRVGYDISTLSSGTYYVVMKTPTVVRSTPLIVQQ
jgi:hypothetical protein